MSLSSVLLEKKNLLRRWITYIYRRISRQPKIIASLTSYPPRIETVHIAIQSLLAQKHLPDLVVLWLYEDDFPNRELDLPLELRRKLAFDFEIHSQKVFLGFAGIFGFSCHYF